MDIASKAVFGPNLTQHDGVHHRMNGQIATLILDDDIWFQRLLREMLLETFPDMNVVLRSTPDPSGEFDVYFIDNRFGDSDEAVRIAQEVRRTAPDALVIAMSADLNADMLRALVNTGCHGAFDKAVPDNLTEVFRVVNAFIESRHEVPVPARAGFVGAVDSIRGLLREWNRRFDQQEMLATSQED